MPCAQNCAEMCIRDRFNADRDALLASMPSEGVDYIIDPGCDAASSRAAIALAEKYPFVYAAVGWQPEEWESWTYELSLIHI